MARGDVQEMIEASVREGVAALGTVARSAFTRLLKLPPHEQDGALAAGALFDEQERSLLAGSLAMVTALAELEGRAIVRRKAARLAAEEFADEWRTIGAKTGADGKKHGGTPVEIDTAGTIKKGPAGVVGKKPEQLKGAKKPGKAAPKPPEREEPPPDFDTPDEGPAKPAPQEGSAAQLVASGPVSSAEASKRLTELPGVQGSRSTAYAPFPHVDDMPFDGDALAAALDKYDVTEEAVPLNKLHTEQVGIERAGVKAYLDNPAKDSTSEEADPRYKDGLVVVRCAGKLYLSDGNHRGTAGVLRGMPTMKAYVVDLPAKAKSHSERRPTLFDERGTPRPMTPLSALRWFLGIIPIPGIADAAVWAEQQYLSAFALASAAGATLAERVRGLLADMLKTGRVAKGPKAVEALLDEAGVTPASPEYGELIVRTNLMEAYNQGTTAEMQAAGDQFPAWRYDGIRDGRQRPAHEAHFGHYFATSVPFTTVRDSIKGSYDGFNCRCAPRPVSKGEWRRLQEKGAAFSSFAEDKQGREHKGKGEGGGQFVKKGKGGEGVDEKPPTKKPEAEPDRSKFIGAVVGKEEHVHSAKVEQEIAGALGAEWEEDNKPYDAQRGKHGFEIKSLLKGSKKAISVHEDALLRKVEWQAAEPGRVFHTVAVDERDTYQGGEHRVNHSGHRLYYKRGSGRYSLSQMHPVKDYAELKRLAALPDDKLPEKARGALPSGDAVAKLRESAEKAHESRLRKDRARKARIRAASQGAPS